ncbi:XRE family transcriptional regulator [Erythrobacter sp. QSSC1-22B]|uniref:helix-turn-helix domain-containing protein n=1 Tax=Erythrobacter sp. QSSC1-22B TaxID=1860125 RepID=UPI000804FF91|nr:helix-turn-helix transcriptional regulator [Erythrobacter sp. QSSC1-22B]OBX17951.1 XRE family transcriptional regulator [Erythrobacter sp. QSSC1-22B]
MDDTERRRALAGRLRDARRLSGFTQGQVAKRMNMHRPTVSEIEAGNRKVSAEELSRFAALYDVGVAFLNGDGPDSLSLTDPRLQLAARELQKLPAESLEKLLQALAAYRNDEKAS